jgi:hypothetical protein
MGKNSVWDQRGERLRDAVGAVEFTWKSNLDDCDCLIAVTSSRLGHDVHVHRQVCQFLTRSMLDCRQRNGVILVASGSAIESWATRAAELFGVPLATVGINDEAASINVRAQVENLSRDAVVIALADRVDAVYVRQCGNIEQSLLARVQARQDASTRVAVSMNNKCAASRLIASGAIGWFYARASTKPEVRPPQASCHRDLDDAWTRTDGQWLIHCTRQRTGAWPGETERQYQDAILLGDSAALARQPIDALARIIRTGRLTAGATATSKKHPVVCFSALPLQELLQRRCFRPQLGRWDYEPYGIAIRTSAAKRLGVVPVIYGPADERSRLAADQQFRFHPIGNTYDWRKEREWRCSESIDLQSLDRADIRVFARESEETESRLGHCPWPVTFVQMANPAEPAGITTAQKGV